jgi:hypothetical protein
VVLLSHTLIWTAPSPISRSGRVRAGVGHQLAHDQLHPAHRPRRHRQPSHCLHGHQEVAGYVTGLPRRRGDNGQDGETEGAFHDAKKMADAIITSQTAEITRMNDLLGKS